MDGTEIIGALRTARRQRGLSQVALAKRAGLALRTVAKLEHGDPPACLQLRTVVDYARAVGLDLTLTIKQQEGEG